MNKTELNDISDKLNEAADEIEGWGGYPSKYFQDKHSLDETVEKYRMWAREYREKAEGSR